MNVQTHLWSDLRAIVLSLIKDLVETQIPNLRVCVTSRPEFDIKDFLDPLIFRSISLHDESGQKRDIEDYIKWVINTRPNTGRWKKTHKKLGHRRPHKKIERDVRRRY